MPLTEIAFIGFSNQQFMMFLLM